jgi:hypothetical protein
VVDERTILVVWYERETFDDVFGSRAYSHVIHAKFVSLVLSGTIAVPDIFHGYENQHANQVSARS